MSIGSVLPREGQRSFLELWNCARCVAKMLIGTLVSRIDYYYLIMQRLNI
jgi:hypothetical protein